jgi:hypothetical protein
MAREAVVGAWHPEDGEKVLEAPGLSQEASRTRRKIKLRSRHFRASGSRMLFRIHVLSGTWALKKEVFSVLGFFFLRQLFVYE